MFRHLDNIVKKTIALVFWKKQKQMINVADLTEIFYNPDYKNGCTGERVSIFYVGMLFQVYWKIFKSPQIYLTKNLKNVDICTPFLLF